MNKKFRECFYYQVCERQESQGIECVINYWRQLARATFNIVSCRG